MARFAKFLPLALLLASTLLVTQAQAFRVERVSPQGVQSRVGTVAIRFSEDMVALGNTSAAAMPVAKLQCNRAEIALAGRWVSTKEWTAQVTKALVAGTQCELVLAPELKALNADSAKLTGPSTFRFSMAAPALLETWPDSGSRIDEQQIFVLRTSAPKDADHAALLKEAKSACVSSKFGESIALELVSVADRNTVLAALKNSFDKETDPNSLIVARCVRPLGEEAKVKLLWGKDAWEYKTWPAFRASVSCEREQANRPCVPVRPIRIEFTSPVQAKLAAAITLEGPQGVVRQSDLALELAKPTAKTGKAKETASQEIRTLEFAPVFAQEASYTVKLPAEFADIQGRKLKLQKPMQVSTSQAPALARFAASFGIVERQVGALPVTVRNLATVQGAGQARLKLRSQHSLDEKTVIDWMRMADYDQRNEYTTRMYPVLANIAGQGVVELPTLASNSGSKDAQVIGIPLTKPGLHRVEIESQALGAAILPELAGMPNRSMYVRSYALVTSMAVHLKTSPTSSLVWVTSLETGKPVADAALTVADCNGTVLWQGKSDASGMAIIAKDLPKPNCHARAAKVHQEFGIPSSKLNRKRAQGEQDDDSVSESLDDRNWLVAFARKADDFSYVLSRWNEGIEPWRFNLPSGSSQGGDSPLAAHTVFARDLLRQGETVHMKHMFRLGTAKGLSRPQEALRKAYTQLNVVHMGSDQQFEVPLRWTDNGTAVSEWVIPKSAKLGVYTVSARAGKDVPAIELGQFQVAEFRLPTVRGTIGITPDLKAQGKPIPIVVQMQFMNGGAAAGLSTSVSAMASKFTPSFAGYDEFDFSTASEALGLARDQDNSVPMPDRLKSLVSSTGNGILLDKKALVLDEKGAGKLELPVAKAGEARRLRVEVNYADPNGEIQTIADTATLWPANLQIAFRQDSWFMGSLRTQQLIALSTQGKPLAGVEITVHAVQKIESSVRKRVVGGFYSYDNSVEYKDIGKVCSGKSEANGLFKCSLSDQAFQELRGNLMLVASAKDAEGNETLTGKSLWVSGSPDDWTAQDNADRFDLLPEKRIVQAGDTARLQARLPFEHATALVAVEREGILSAFVTRIDRSNPVIEVPISAQHAPNVMVSVLAIRPRLEPLGWGSFFRWGWRSPLEWWKARKESKRPPTAMVDLAKPSFRFGVAELQVPASPALKVTVSATPERLQVREQVSASIQVAPASGTAALPAGGTVAVAVVDEALLELKANDSWDVVAGLWRRRAYEVETATAQMQVIGKRHFGLKAQAPGGGGGRGPTRELFDTLLYWNPAVKLDAQGRATVQFKVNDALTRFRVVVLADVADDLVGRGQASIEVSKDLQIIAGLPPIVRDSDQLTASAVLRNTTNRVMSVKFAAILGGNTLSEQTISLAAQSSQTVTWPFTAPVLDGLLATQELKWTLRATEVGAVSVKSVANDEMLALQVLHPSVRTGVVAAQLLRLDGEQSLPLANPAQALPGRTRIQVDLSSSLIRSLGPVRRYFEEYPFACLEQRSSKAIGLRDNKLWQIIQESLPTYLDADGMAGYFPSSDFASSNRGSDVLTAYILSLSHAANWTLPDEPKARMLNALEAFVQGKLKRTLYTPARINANAPRLLAAMDALSRHGKLTAAQLAVIEVQPEVWPTSAVIDWAAVLTRTSFPAAQEKQRDQWLDQAWGVLRNRMKLTGTEIAFDDEKRDNWWWMMSGADANASKLLLLALESAMPQAGTAARAGLAEWLQDLPRMANGLMKRQRNGIWPTTTANVWGSLALEAYAKAFERDPVVGVTQMQIGNQTLTAPWNKPSPSMSWVWSQSERETKAVLVHKGNGKPYASLTVAAAIPITAPVNAGYKVTKTITPVSQAQSGKVQAGDVFRIELEILASQAMTWVAVHDPIPAGATVLSGSAGGGLRSSEIEQVKSAAVAPARAPSWDSAWPAYEELRFDSYRSFYEYFPAGKTLVSYTMRVSQAGVLKLPSTRVEAMYAPDVYGEFPNSSWTVHAR